MCTDFLSLAAQRVLNDTAENQTRQEGGPESATVIRVGSGKEKCAEDKKLREDFMRQPRVVQPVTAAWYLHELRFGMNWSEF